LKITLLLWPVLPKYLAALGFVAGSLTTLSFIPQLLRTWQLRGAHGISGWWLATFMTGVTLWLFYGLMLPSVPVIVANAATLSLTLPILAIKIYYRRRAQSAGENGR
jgi:MtN3 and saliva related transmembrane protein